MSFKHFDDDVSALIYNVVLSILLNAIDTYQVVGTHTSRIQVVASRIRAVEALIFDTLSLYQQYKLTIALVIR